MAEIFKFFNSAPGDERWHYASDFADYFGSVLTSGLLHENGSYGLQVTVNSGTLTTNVAIGKALIKGYSYENTNDLTLTHSLPEQTLDRLDRIVLRLDLRNANRFIKAFVKEGTSATNPIAPDLQRDNYVYELSLATVRVRANTSSISVNDITDTRALESVCGIVQSLITVPTSMFQQQFDVWFNAQKALYEADLATWTSSQKLSFNQWLTQQQNDWGIWRDEQNESFIDWLTSLRTVLDGDTAGHLFNLIETNRVNIEQIQQDMKVDFDNIDSVLTSHVQKTASDTELGHVKSDGETTVINNGVISAKMTDSVTGEKWSWKMENGLAFIEKEVI